MVAGSYWLSMENRKKHFDEYAKSQKFDPLIAENWYHLSSMDIRKYKVHMRCQWCGGCDLLIYSLTSGAGHFSNTTTHQHQRRC